MVVYRKKNRTEKGASMVEYALMIALVTIVAITGIGVLGRNTSDVFQNTSRAISSNG